MKASVIDFHSHILPGIDDGSDSVEMSLAMLMRSRKQGIGHVVATPHFYARHDTPEAFLARRARAEARLRQAMAGEAGMPRLTMGAEVAFYPGMSGSDALGSLCIGQSRYILVELPGTPWYNSIYEELQAIWDRQGLVPVIAHVDRYLEPFRTERLMGKLEDLPVLIQANAEFFLRRSTARTAFRLLRNGRIHLLGSDCHNLSSRAPNLGQAVEEIRWKLGREALAWIAEHQREILSADKENDPSYAGAYVQY
ncbi:MAG: capsular polysaccharide biosynthesis protein [Ruminiclostridium sp.]|nr:capsular polysaccharide biosynthesis protein [Ruminiclostridium sp.]